MNEKLKELAAMFYPLDDAEQARWAGILALSDDGYAAALADEAGKRGLRQDALDGAVAWSDGEEQLMLLFRLPDPRDLDAVRRVYDVIAANEAPLAYTFVHQVPDGEGTWDIFHMSVLTYLAHCNRVSGPGSGCKD
jgi:hypothetical protein